MSVPHGLSALVLGGIDRAAALDWLHVHACVVGAEEVPDAITVWCRGMPPRIPAAELGLELTVTDRVVRAEDFGRTGLEHDAVILVAPDLLVRPPWVSRPRAFEGIELVVPRGGAFGSGEDDSTKVALVAMHRCWHRPASFADVGTGSGILSLYARIRGCREIAACDIDAPSVAAARALLPGADVRIGGAEVLESADMLVSNMTGAELLSALPALLGVWTRRAPLVVSGLRGTEADRFESALRNALPADGRRRMESHRERLGAFTAIRFQLLR